MQSAICFLFGIAPRKIIFGLFINSRLFFTAVGKSAKVSHATSSLRVGFSVPIFYESVWNSISVWGNGMINRVSVNTLLPTASYQPPIQWR